MKTKIFVALLAASLTAAAAGPQTFTGVITDTMCGKDHAHMNIQPIDKCVRECVKAGEKYALLLPGGQIYKLSDQKAPELFAAKTVKVTGTLFEKTGIIKVDRIEAVRR